LIVPHIRKPNMITFKELNSLKHGQLFDFLLDSYKDLKV